MSVKPELSTMPTAELSSKRTMANHPHAVLVTGISLMTWTLPSPSLRRTLSPISKVCSIFLYVFCTPLREVAGHFNQVCVVKSLHQTSAGNDTQVVKVP